MGNIGGDVEIHSTNAGAVAVPVATNDGYRNSSGEWVDDVTAPRGRLLGGARHAGAERQKGRTVALSGRMTYRKWRKDGEQTDRTQAEIVLDRNAEIEFHSPLAE